jgi:CRISPR-associated endonuclease Cas1
MKTISIDKSQRAIALHGHGVKVYTQRGHLVLEDGVADEREVRRIPRATRGVSRIVMHGSSGYVTFEAMQWMKDTQIRFVQLGYDDDVIAMSDFEPDIHLDVLRAQVETSRTSAALETAKSLIRRKLEGQQRILEDLESAAAEEFPELIRQLSSIASNQDLLSLEAVAAHKYWVAWTGVPIRFKDPANVPEHWLHFRSRVSTLSRENARYAVDPINAILNYLYQLVYVETSLVLRTIGLDQRIGVFHIDIRGRNSLACDVMEAVRPTADRWVLQYLRSRQFLSSDFFERRNGQVRLMPTVTDQLVATMPRWSKECRKTAKRVFEDLMGRRIRTRRNRT